MLIVTAFNSGFSQLGKLCLKSVRHYCRTNWEIGYRSRIIPSNYQRSPSWAKIGIIKNFLKSTDYVMWIDSDAMIVGRRDFREMIEPVALNISEDDNGINCGVTAWKNCPQTFDALDRMESLYEEFKDHKWFEQAALMTFVHELDVCYQPKHIWNAYPDEVAGDGMGDVSDETQIIHLPGMSIGERWRFMNSKAKEIGI